MGIIKSTIKSFTTKDAGRGFINSPLYPLKNSGELLELKKGWVYTCMNIRATELANSNFIFEENNKEIMNQGHWIYLLKENPNPNYTWFDLFQLISFWLDLDGNCYILPKFVTKGGVTIPVSFTVLPSNRVHLEVNDESVSRYRVSLPNNKYALIDAEDMIHIKDMSPSFIANENFYKGTPSALESIKDVQEIWVKRLDYIESFYEGDGVMPYIMTSDNDEFGGDEAQKVFETFNSQIQNPKYKMQAVLPMGIKPVNLGEAQGGQGAVSSEDNESIRIQITAAFGIPESYVTGKYNSRAAAYDTIQVMNEKTTEPRANKVAYYFNQFFARLNLKVKMKHVPVPFRNDEFVLRQSSTLFQLGIIDRDEARIENGYEPEGLVLVNPESEKKTLNRNLTRSIGTG